VIALARLSSNCTVNYIHILSSDRELHSKNHAVSRTTLLGRDNIYIYISIYISKSKAIPVTGLGGL
jgi:hypothetical protein